MSESVWDYLEWNWASIARVVTEFPFSFHLWRWIPPFLVTMNATMTLTHSAINQNLLFTLTVTAICGMPIDSGCSVDSGVVMVCWTKVSLGPHPTCHRNWHYFSFSLYSDIWISSIYVYMKWGCGLVAELGSEQLQASTMVLFPQFGIPNRKEPGNDAGHPMEAHPQYDP